MPALSSTRTLLMTKNAVEHVTSIRCGRLGAREEQYRRQEEVLRSKWLVGNVLTYANLSQFPSLVELHARAPRPESPNGARAPRAIPGSLSRRLQRPCGASACCARRAAFCAEDECY